MLYFTSCPIGILNVGLATTFLSGIRKYSNIRSFELELFDMTNEQFVSTLNSFCVVHACPLSSNQEIKFEPEIIEFEPRDH